MLVVITISSLPPAPPPWSFSIDVILVDVLLVVCNEVLDDFRCNRDFFPPGTTLFWPLVLLFWLLIATVSFLCVWGWLKFPFVDELDDELVWLELVWRLYFRKENGSEDGCWNKWIAEIEFPRTLVFQRMLIVIYHLSFHDVKWLYSKWTILIHKHGRLRKPWWCISILTPIPAVNNWLPTMD